MSGNRRENLFAKLAAQQPKPEEPEAAPAVESPVEEEAPPPPALPEPVKRKASPARKPEPTKGKRNDPSYCQANAYIPKNLRRSVEKAILDIDGLDYSTLVEDLLRKWVKARGVSE